MLQNFKTFTANRMDLDELIELAAYGRQVRNEYESHQVEEPPYVGEQLNALRREIAARVADKKAARITSIRQQLAGLETAGEKRDRLKAELAKLEPEAVTA